MNQFLTFAFIGGDSRQLQVISRFIKEGFSVRAYGLDISALKIAESPSLDHCISGADIIVLPIPYSSGGGLINSAFNAEIPLDHIISKMSKDQLLLVGCADKVICDLADSHGIRIIDYAKREELAIRNSIPTVEGAIEIAMAETPFTIHKSRCLILGYGRIGKILANTLNSLGASCTVAARRPEALAWVSANSLKSVSFQNLSGNIGGFDLIFNTVPSLILDEPLLSEVSDGCLIIDLASKPGGVDFDAAGKLGKKVIWALSLPGKCAPVTAGDIIKDTISNILEELGV